MWAGRFILSSIRRRRGGCLDRPPRAAPHRRSGGAPASPLRYSASRACRTSFAGTPRASRRWAFGVAAAQLARWPPAGGPAVRHGAARERGRRRSAYEAPHGSVAPGSVVSGAESKRRRCPRSRARTSRGAPLADAGDVALDAAEEVGMRAQVVAVLGDGGGFVDGVDGSWICVV